MDKDTECFEELLTSCKSSVERFVYYRMPSKTDGDDVLQEIYLSAFQKFGTLKDKNAFKMWLIRIAKNKCADFFRAQKNQVQLPFDEITENMLTKSELETPAIYSVRDTLEKLSDKDRQILYLYFFAENPQSEIAKALNIPLGTVKSRLYTAKQNFKKNYLCRYSPIQELSYQTAKGEIYRMKKLPEYMPEYKITQSDETPFPVKWEEVMGWFIVPKLGEKLSWAMYDFPERKRTELCEMEVTGKAEVHGIEGVEIVSVEYDPMECNSAGGQNKVERHFVAQLTDTHCRLLAESHTENGIKKYYTFLDGDEFLNNWGFGEDNCGNEINIFPKGEIIKNGNIVSTEKKPYILDVTGRYTVEINEKKFDTVCVVDFYAYVDGVVSEQYLDKNGKTILWRRFNRDDFAFSRYGQKWSEILPNNERLYVNGETYVHWYDCITDYIL